MTQNEFLTQLSTTATLLGFRYRDRNAGFVFIYGRTTNLTYVRIILEDEPKLYVLDTLYSLNDELDLPTGVTEYTLDQLPELLQVTTQYLVDILEASREQDKAI